MERKQDPPKDKIMDLISNKINKRHAVYVDADVLFDEKRLNKVNCNRKECE
jgi:hypothetical protein